MQRASFSIDEADLAALRRLAEREGQSLSDVVREAIGQFLRTRDGDDGEWQLAFDRLVQRMRARLPAGISEDEAERDVTAAREDVRRLHRARGR